MTSFRVESEDSLAFWRERLRAHDVYGEDAEDPQGRPMIRFSDPEGLSLAIVAAPDLPTQSVPWTHEVPEEHALRGIVAVLIPSSRPEQTRMVLEFLGFETVMQRNVAVMQVANGQSSGQVRLASVAGRPGRPGAGGVHHVAFRVKDDDELRAYQEKIESRGATTSGFVDRFWFHSLYFREPGGVLFELATDGPGFAADEDPEHLGEALVLPPFLEDRRQEIEANLRPI
jgi:glyoxalase family protein